METRTVIDKLGYAQNRLDKLVELARMELFFSEFDTRQRVMQEFFFHLLGSVEYLMQLVNNRLELGHNPVDVTIKRTIKSIGKIEKLEQLSKVVQQFWINTNEVSHIETPYTKDGMMLRIINYRNRVAHRGMNPYNIVIDKNITAYILIDPDRPEHGHSEKEVISELSDMYNFVSEHINESIRILDKLSTN